MEHRGMRVSWSFSSTEWLDLRDAVRRVGIPALVEHAERMWSSAKQAPFSAKYFLAAWCGLQEAPVYTGPRPVGPPSQAQSYLAEMQAIAAEYRAAEGGTA
jgi:hypothetical protein